MFREMYTILDGVFDLYKSEMEATSGLLEQEVKKNKSKSVYNMKLSIVLVFVLVVVLF